MRMRSRYRSSTGLTPVLTTRTSTMTTSEPPKAVTATSIHSSRRRQPRPKRNRWMWTNFGSSMSRKARMLRVMMNRKMKRGGVTRPIEEEQSEKRKQLSRRMPTTRSARNRQSTQPLRLRRTTYRRHRAPMPMQLPTSRSNKTSAPLISQQRPFRSRSHRKSKNHLFLLSWPKLYRRPILPPTN